MAALNALPQLTLIDDLMSIHPQIHTFPALPLHSSLRNLQSSSVLSIQVSSSPMQCLGVQLSPNRQTVPKSRDRRQCDVIKKGASAAAAGLVYLSCSLPALSYVQHCRP